MSKCHNMSILVCLSTTFVSRLLQPTHLCRNISCSATSIGRLLWLFDTQLHAVTIFWSHSASLVTKGDCCEQLLLLKHYRLLIVMQAANDSIAPAKAIPKQAMRDKPMHTGDYPLWRPFGVGLRPRRPDRSVLLPVPISKCFGFH